MATSVFINEFHYDNVGTDTGEFIEIAGPAGTNLTGWQLARYNGSTPSSAVVYTSPGSITLSGVIPDQGSGFGTLTFTLPTDGLQNGTSDGFALVDPNGSVVQLLSYEGVFTAGNGPAAGLTSVDVGVSQTSSTPVGASLQLTGTGTVYEDFTWAVTTVNTSGSINAGQTFVAPNNNTVDLSTYVRIGRYNLPEPTRTTAPTGNQLAQEVSAITYNSATDTLFVLGDEGTSIVQITKTGQLIDSMTLAAGIFNDPEGLTYVSNGNQFVLVEERERQASLFTYVPGGTLTRADVQTVKLGTTVGNIGLEGISFDPQTGDYILVKETNPQGIFQTGINFAAGTATNGSPTTENSTNLFDPALANLTDIADVYALSNLLSTDDNLLVLSQEDGRIINVDRTTGEISSSLAIASDADNPLTVAGQGHEGVTMDSNGLLYIVNEQGGGDSNHPQLWVYAPASFVFQNAAPVEVSLSNVTPSLAENVDTSAPIQVGTIIISDDALGTNTLSLGGTDATAFEIVGSGLFLKAGTVLDFETKPSFEVIVNVDDLSIGNTPDASTSFTLAIADTTDTPAALIISEVAPWSSGNSPGVGADWFEVTNTSTTAVDITGWRIDDDSASFANSSALSGVTSIAPGQSVIFVDGDANTINAFVNTWFGGTLPSGVAIGTYGGPGLGTGGDAVNLFDASGALVTGVTFGASPAASPFASFDNAAGLSFVSTLSATGVNGAFSVIDVGVNEAAVLIGSPGSISVSPVPLTTLVAIAATDAAAAEAGQNPGTFTILRTGDTTDALTVVYGFAVGTGQATSDDYTPILTGNVEIPAGANSVDITITPVDDPIPEGTETVTLVLFDEPGYDLGTNTSATVTIADNDSAIANFNLQVTEIWSGNSVGSNLTADWFELTNLGTEAWVSGVAPDLYYDDSPPTPANAVLIGGITQIDPGESVVVVIGTAPDAQTFSSVWSSVIDLTGVDIGFTNGAGLGANGDGVALFVGLPGTASVPADFETYPAGSAGQSYNVDLMGFSVAGSNGAVATAPNANGQSAVGSPGNGNPIVVEPSKILNETFDYAENGEPRAFTLTDASGTPIDFFGEATSFDYFGVLDGNGDGGSDFGPSPNVTPTSFNAYTGFDDNHLIASDIDGGSPAIADPAFLTWSGLNIAGLSNLLFSVDVATLDSDNGLDPDDFLKFEISVDGGAFQPILAFETADGTTFNQTTFLQDTDFDGIGDGAALTAAAQTFTKIFSVSGTTLDLRAAIRVEAGFEDIGFDNVVLEEASGSFVSIAATDAAKAEGDTGITDFTFTVTRTGDISGAASVNFAVSGDVDAADFGGTLPSGTVTFAPNETSQVITLGVSGDTVLEPNESFTVTLSNPTAGASLVTASATGVIQNDEAPPLTLISTIQGNLTTQLPNTSTRGAHDDISPFIGQSVTVRGVVTAVFNDLNAFFLQEEITDSDGNATTSEGIFVFVGSDPTVSEGNIVTVTGAVDEFFGMTQLDNDNGDFSITVNDATNAGLSLIAPAIIDLPATGDINDFYEQYEGMLVQFSDKLVVSEYFELARFGQIVLTESDRPFQYTHLDNTPTAAEFQAFQEDLARRQIILDDGNNIQNAPLPNGTFFHPQPNGFGTGTQGTDFFRGGDSVTNLTGVLHWSFPGFGANEWRIRPTEANPIEFTVENPRPTTPADVGGNIKVANFNVLNYFTTLNEGSNTVGPSNLEPRGANSVDEFARQTEKLVAALTAIDADVFGLVEIENDADDSTLQTLVDALNAKVGAGTYAFIPTGFDGTDAIKVAILYKPGVVTPTAGRTVVLEDAAFTDPNNTGLQRNRPALAQEFEVTNPSNLDFGESFSVVVNHLKSKGASGLDTNPSTSPTDNDQGDGQGFWNNTRADAAAYLVNTWIPQLIAQGFDEDFLITGDLNAYRGEDPITAIKNAGYTDLIEQFIGDEAYSFVFDGQLGYLDHALASASLTSQVTGVTEWSINADEVNVFDYNNTVRDGNEQSFEAKPTGNNLYEPNPFRTSDHDPVIVGLDLASPKPVSLSFGQRLSRLVMQAFQDGELIGEERGKQNGVAPSVDPFTLFAINSADSGRRANFVDRTWLDQGEGIGIADGDDGNSSARKRIDGDELLGIRVTGFEAKDALVNVDRITFDDDTSISAMIQVQALRNGAVIDSEVFNLGAVSRRNIQTLNFSSEGFFDTLYVSAVGDTQFTFRSVELPQAFAV